MRATCCSSKSPSGSGHGLDDSRRNHEGLAPVGTAGAALLAAWVAYRGLEGWRAETSGKREAELAEEVLADSCRAREVFRWARAARHGEIVTVSRLEDDSEKEERDRARFYAPIERLERRNPNYSLVLLPVGTDFRPFLVSRRSRRLMSWL